MAAIAGRLMLQAVYPQLRKYPWATAVTLGAKERTRYRGRRQLGCWR